MTMAGDQGVTVLCWPGRLLAEEDLRRHWTSQREIVLGPRTVVTPLAWDWLRARKVQVRRETRIPSVDAKPGIWAYADETGAANVAAAMRALAAEGRHLAALEGPRGSLTQWVRGLSEAVAAGDPPGLCLFCREPGLVICIANKISGIRGAAVALASEVESLERSLGPNLYAIAPGGRTYFELRQLLLRATRAAPRGPAELANTLRELDGHAHR